MILFKVRENEVPTLKTEYVHIQSWMSNRSRLILLTQKTRKQAKLQGSIVFKLYLTVNIELYFLKEGKQKKMSPISKISFWRQFLHHSIGQWKLNKAWCSCWSEEIENRSSWRSRKLEFSGHTNEEVRAMEERTPEICIMVPLTLWLNTNSYVHEWKSMKLNKTNF